MLSIDSRLCCAVRKSQGITGAGKSSTANTMMKLRPENNSMHTSLSQARSMGAQLEASREGTKYTRELFQKKSQLDNGERRLNKNFPVSGVRPYAVASCSSIVARRSICNLILVIRFFPLIAPDVPRV